MVTFYQALQSRFTIDIQAQFVYLTLELTRWGRGLYEAMKPFEVFSVEGLVCVWAHEGHRRRRQLDG